MLNLLFTGDGRTASLHHGWDLELEGNVSHYACCCVCTCWLWWDNLGISFVWTAVEKFQIWHQRLVYRCCFLSGVARYLKLSCLLLQVSGFVCSSRCIFLKTAFAGEHIAPMPVFRICTMSLWNWRFHSPVVGFFYDDPRTCLTPCVDTRTWKGGPTGIAMAIRGRPVGVTNSLNRNWIYRNETFRG